MNKEAHTIFSVAFSVTILDSILKLETSYILFIVVFSIVGSKLPDIDLRYKHRALLHNILAIFITSLIFYIVLSIIVNKLRYIPTDLAEIGAISFFLGYTSHLLLDALTIKGIAIFYPMSSKYYRLANLRSTSRVVNVLVVVLSAILILLVLLT